MKILISTTMNIPIYEQIVNQIRDAVISGELSAGEGMPSIRMLEKEGVIESIPGRGFYVCEQKNDHLREKQMINLEEKYADIITESKSAGMSLNDVIELITLLYEE